MCCRYIFKKIKSWLPNVNVDKPEVIQAKSSCIQVIFTIVLLGITAYYTFDTHKMSEIMSQEFQSNNRPYLNAYDSSVITRHYLDTNEDVIELNLIIKNVGKIPGVLQSTDVYTMTLDGETTITKNLLLHNFIIFPDDQTEINHKLTKNKVLVKLLNNLDSFKFIFKINYLDMKKFNNYFTEQTFFCIKVQQNNQDKWGCSNVSSDAN